MAIVLLIELWRALRGTLPSTWAGQKSDEASMAIDPALTQEKMQ